MTERKPKFSEISPPLSEYAQRGIDPLVARDCVLLDGKCDCPRPVYDTCKYGEKK